MRTLILASSSSYRRALLEQLRLPFQCAAPHINEEALAGEDASTLASRLAAEKAAALRHQFAGSLIIGSDQVAECDGRLLGKPGTAAKARAQLQYCAGKPVHFYTGLSIYDTKSNFQVTECERYSVHFRHLSAGEIERYVELDNPLDCAGSFKVEGLGIALFEKMEGSDPNTLIGLPLIRLVSMLAQFGVSPLAPASA